LQVSLHLNEAVLEQGVALEDPPAFSLWSFNTLLLFLNLYLTKLLQLWDSLMKVFQNT
jgi:hypothetical protein